MKKSERLSNHDVSISPAEQWDAINDRIFDEQPLRQASASSTWGMDEIQPRPADNSATTAKKKNAIDFLSHMLCPAVRLLSPSGEQQTYRGARQVLHQTDAPDGIPLPWDIDLTLIAALQQYRRRLEADTNYDYQAQRLAPAASPFLSESRFRSIVRGALKKSEAAYKVGASLYIYHQMTFLRKSPLPSLSKSQFLIDNAALYQVPTELHTRRGDPRKIGESWGKYFAASHYWAAYVVMSGNPFILPEEALPRFLLADMEEFKRLAATFLQFRRFLSDSTPLDSGRTQPHIFRALHTDLTRADFEGVLPLPDSEVPNLVADFQWQSLDQYSSGRQAPALRRSRKHTPTDDGLAW